MNGENHNLQDFAVVKKLTAACRRVFIDVIPENHPVSRCFCNFLKNSFDVILNVCPRCIYIFIGQILMLNSWWLFLSIFGFVLPNNVLCYGE